ncbi:hypothetical protein V2J09_011856 [Rumex salicifolius]
MENVIHSEAEGFHLTVINYHSFGNLLLPHLLQRQLQPITSLFRRFPILLLPPPPPTSAIHGNLTFYTADYEWKKSNLRVDHSEFLLLLPATLERRPLSLRRHRSFTKSRRPRRRRFKSNCIRLMTSPPTSRTSAPTETVAESHVRNLRGEACFTALITPFPTSSLTTATKFGLALPSSSRSASMTLILGFYGSYSMQLGPNCSQLITANELFVQSIVGQQTEGSSGPMLYGFHSSPALDVETTWSETRNASVESNFHKEWMYYLNAGSKVEISYDVKNTSSSLSLVVAQGEESLIEWIEDPSYPNITLSWNTIYGSGSIEQDITSSDSYYVAVGNLDSNTIQVQLNLTIKAVLYNTTEAFFKCSVYNKACSFSCFFLKKNAVIITSPGPEQVKDDEDFYVRISYGPRWLTYILGSGILTIVVLLLFRICNFFRPSHLDGTQTGREADNQEPLISPKDDDLSSWGSSYDSVSNDDEDLDEWIHGQGNQQPTEEGENSANPRKLCVICFDSPRDCFFLPCGHCAACFTCGSRIAEEAGTCPICRRRMKKVRKIFSVTKLELRF